MDSEHYDAIIIGSGIGAMTVAAGLAFQKGWRCLILEQNFNLGGMTHEFVRKPGYKFPVGLHYVGQMESGGFMRRLMDYITGGQFEWRKIPDVFEHFSYPDMQFDVPSAPDRFLGALIAAFPDEERPLRRYVQDMRRIFRLSTIFQFAEMMPPPLRRLVRWLVPRLAPDMFVTTQDYLDRQFRDERLKALLATQWGDHGTPPDRSSLVIHAMIACHYLHGAYFPAGGAGKIAEGFFSQFRAAGGCAIPGYAVEQIMLDATKSRVVGVRARNTLRNGGLVTYHAPVVISDAGAAQTYLHLLEPDAPLPFRDELKQVHPSYSAVMLFLGFGQSPETVGFRGENHWVCSGRNHHIASLETCDFGTFYLSFSSIKSGETALHTAEMMVLVEPSAFALWADKPWRQRGQEYEQLKQLIEQNMLAALRRYAPRLADMVTFYELATPLTFATFQKSQRGAFYQLPFTPARLNWSFARSRTPVAGLYLTGADVLSPGIVGAMMGGFKCLGCLLPRLDFLRFLVNIMFRSPPRNGPAV